MQLSISLIATMGGEVLWRQFGIVAIILSVGMIICFLAVLGYNFHLTYSKEKIEVHAENSNSDKLSK